MILYVLGMTLDREFFLVLFLKRCEGELKSGLLILILKNKENKRNMKKQEQGKAENTIVV